jgi:hypothetical protein
MDTTRILFPGLMVGELLSMVLNASFPNDLQQEIMWQQIVANPHSQRPRPVCRMGFI